MEALSAAVAAYERHEYTLGADGSLSGTVLTADAQGSAVLGRLRLCFIRDGKTVVDTIVGEDGGFRAAGLTPGYYSVVVAGQRGVSAVGVRVLPPRSGVFDNRSGEAVEPTIDPIPLIVSTIHPIDVRPAFYLAQRYVPGLYSTATPLTPAGRRGYPSAAAATADVRMAARIPVAPVAETVLTSEMLEAYRTYQFPLNSTGSFGGRIRSIVGADGPVAANVRLFLLRDGRVVRPVTVDGTGAFDTGPIEAGQYSLVAVGPDGMAAAGVRLVAASAVRTAGHASALVQPVSVRQVENPVSFNLAVIALQDVAQTQEIAQQEDAGGVGEQPPPAGAPFAGGSGPAGGGGGGGGLGGMGGALAGAALAGGLAGGIGAASDNGGSTSITTTVSNSPTTTGSGSSLSSGSSGSGSSGGSGGSGGTSGSGGVITGGSSGSGVTLGSGSSSGGGLILTGTN